MKAIILRSMLVFALCALGLGMAAGANVARADDSSTGDEGLIMSPSQAALEELRGSMTELVTLVRPDVSDVTVQLLADESDSASPFLVLGVTSADGTATYDKLNSETLQGLFAEAAASDRISGDTLATLETSIVTQARMAIPA